MSSFTHCFALLTSRPNFVLLSDSIFTITERMRGSNSDGTSTVPVPAGTSSGSATPSSSSNNNNTGGGSGAAGDAITVARKDSFDSMNSDHQWTGKSRVVTLRASSPEVRPH